MKIFLGELPSISAKGFNYLILRTEYYDYQVQTVSGPEDKGLSGHIHLTRLKGRATELDDRFKHPISFTVLEAITTRALETYGWMLNDPLAFTPMGSFEFDGYVQLPMVPV
jgi:hypothetical protein